MKRLIDIICSGGFVFCSALGYADGLDLWHVRYRAPEGIYFGSIAAGQDRFVSVGTNGRIVTSTDAIQWTLADSGTTVNLENVASGNGAFVAMAVPDTVIRSTDGTNWHSAGWQEPAARPGIVTFANGQFFLLASEVSGAPRLFVSSSGAEWSSNRFPHLPGDFSALLHSLAYGNGNYVAVGEWRGPDELSDTGPLVRISPDTFTWENIFVPDWVLWPYSVLWRNRVEFTSVTFGNGMFVAVGSDVNLVSCLVYSPDGRNWKLAEDAFRGMYSVAYGDGVFVAVGVGQIASSTDGIHWRKRDPGKNFISSSVTHGQNTFVCFDNGSNLMQSDLIVSLMLGRSSPLELSIFGPIGKTFQVEATEDLGATNGWATVASFVLTNSPSTWVDSGSTNKSQRFYRAALQP